MCGGPMVSNKPTRTVVEAVPTVVEGGAVVTVGVVVGVVVVATAFGPTEKTPFMPAAAWPETVLRYGYRPLFENVTRKVAERPGKSTPAASPVTVSAASRTTLPRRMGNASSEVFICVPCDGQSRGLKLYDPSHCQ